ncbi:hypothetical protein HZS_4399 [Henneguya salminicola]|nr:hypothetical protein HZS_4399 [Henneguya salminicola]
MKAGSCNKCVTRWYFNTQTFQCVSFTYGGCKGNDNNFNSLKECEINCPESIRKYVCSLPPAKGIPCLTSSTRFYYSVSKKSCQPFVYYGCGGNGNNFIYIDWFLSIFSIGIFCSICEFIDTLIIDDIQQRYITDKRRCNDAIPNETCQNDNLEVRWYFDKLARKCRGYFSKSCSRTVNSFYNRDECYYSCLKQDCKQEPDPGPCGPRFVTMWHYDHATRQCKIFLYGGCGGNSNRFFDNVECYDVCVRSH